ncbi:hypothetical protein [Arthrobacter sp.]|uniref:hypothetical protein n=1 Tax=Arthrobacter sp. TaxID=1667 RepID=UPI003A9243B0
MTTNGPPSLTESIVRGIGYLLIGTSGVWVLFAPPRTIEGAAGTLLTTTWGIFLLAALIACVATVWRRYRVEYAVLPIMAGGVLIYAATLLALVPGTITRGPQALLMTALSCAIIARLASLHRLVNAWKEREWMQSS